MSGNDDTAKSKFQLRILPAGKNDRMVEISDATGNPLKYVHSSHRLGNSEDEYLDQRMLRDWETMDADAFATRYGIPE